MVSRKGTRLLGKCGTCRVDQENQKKKRRRKVGVMGWKSAEFKMDGLKRNGGGYLSTGETAYFQKGGGG